jgi:hypothetical protein
MNKTGKSSDDIFEWVKIAIAVTIGIIVIRALLQAT